MRCVRASRHGNRLARSILGPTLNTYKSDSREHLGGQPAPWALLHRPPFQDDVFLNGYSMRRQSFSTRFPCVAAGVIFALPVWLAFVPNEARAGCSHLVTSKSNRDAALFTSLIPEISSDRTSGSANPYQPLETPQAPRRCQGAWCSENPSAPAAPIGIASAYADSWACCEPTPNGTLIACSRLFRRTLRCRALHRSATILRPPRRPFICKN
jgi:hypothetical protein